ncbi:MAG: hypothetical protein LBI20_01225 [Holosporales bacterium]|nr:hypothetical protein [Holosporales bacterium]
MTRNALLGFLSTGLRLLENVAYDCAGYFDLLLDWVSTLQSQIELLDCFMLSECPSSPDTGHPTFFSAPIKAFLLQRGLDPATLSTAGYQVVSDGAKALLLLLTVRCVNWIYYLLPSNPTALLTDGLGLIKQNDLPPSVLIPVALRLHDFVDNFEFPSCMSHLPPEFATLPNDLAQARESRRLLLNHLQTPLSPTDYQASLAKMTTPLDAQPGPHVSDLSTAVSESDTAARSFSETYGDVAGAPPPDLNMGAPPSHPVDSDPEADRGPGEPSGDPAVGAPRPDAEMIDPDNPDGEDDEHEAPSVGFDGEAIVDPVVPTSPLETQMRPLLVPLYEGLDLLEQLVSSNTADLDLIADVSTNIYEGLHPIRQSLHAIRATDPESFARLDDELTALHDKRQRVMCLFAANFFPTAFALANRSKQRIEIMLSLPRINPFSFDPQVRMLCIALRVAEMDVSYSRLPPELRNLRDALYDILQQFPTILSDIKRRLPPDHYANLHRSLVAVPFPLHGDTVEEEETEELPGTGLQGWITSSQSPPASFLPGSRGESFPAPGAGGEPRGPLAIMPLALLNNHALFRDVRLEDRVFKVETTVIRRRDDVRLLGLPPLSDQSLERGIRRMFDTDTRELSHLIVGTQLVEVRRIPQAPTRR